MARTTSIAVRGILLRDYDSVNSPDLTPFIESATVLVDRVVACATAKGITLSSTELELIERWLSAHSYCMNDPQYKEKTTGRAKAVFMGGGTPTGLGASRYGNMALSLDPSGCLKSSTEGKRLGAYWLGLDPSEQTPVEQRD